MAEVATLAIYFGGFMVMLLVCSLTGATKTIKGQNASFICALIWPAVIVILPWIIAEDMRARRKTKKRGK
jgi:hypothetical protein